MKPRVWPSLTVAGAFAALLIGLAMFNRANTANVEAAAQSVSHTHAVTTELAELLSTLVDAETGQRGFVITGQERYLQPYQAAVSQVLTHIDRVAGLTADNGEQQTDIPRVRALTADKLTELDESIRVRRERGFAAAEQLVATDRGKRIMDDLRSVVARMTAREQELLRVRDLAAQRSSSRARWAGVATTAVAVAAVGLVWFGFRRHALDRARSAETLAASERRLREALDAKNQFLAAVSHELRTPINVIVGWAAQLRAGTIGPERTASVIASIERNAQTLSRVIEDLLESSRLLAGKVRLESDAIDLAALLNEAVEAVRLGADNKGVTLDIQTDPVPQLYGDAVRLKQVVWNILGNAIKFTPPGGAVSVRTSVRDGVVRVSIRDTGPGIAPALLPHIFDAFRQGEEQPGSGLGLGLAIARQLVELHGGTIEATSDRDGGAEFVISLPVRIY